ncbi:retrovirus-related Pol polyprotein from transposon 412 [Trichonephila clavipes]|nr:retrovirus-related Pol polyprotein from transposon 412 [Trichonephila clavipes]
MKTFQKVRERFCGSNVWSDVEKYCRACDHCAARKNPRKQTRGRLQLYNVEAPFERISFDILGPLPRSSDDNNNVLVVMDYFTKWPEVYPNSDQEASTVAEVLAQHWISRLGFPPQLHSDKGINFDSEQSTGLGQEVALFLLDYRSAVHEITGYSSSQMLFRRDICLPADLLFSRPADAPLSLEEYIEKLQARMEEMHHLARERTGMTSEKIKIRYDTRAISTKATKCDYGIRNVTKDSLQSCISTGKVLTQS